MEKHLRVLIVEDSEDDTLLAVSELESSGYDVDFIRVDTSEAMSHALETHSWDIVISDHSMPHFTSEEALKQVLDTGKVIPFILLTGTIGEEGAAQIMRAGADDFLLKASLGRLGPVVDRCIQHAAERRVLPETQKSLLESGARLKMALEASGMGMWNLEVLTGKFVVDEQSARLAGLRLDEIDPTLELWTDLIHPDDRDRALRVFRAHLEGVTPVYEDEYRIVDRKGRCKWILSKGKVIERGEDGTPLRVAGTYLDITERRQQSDALRESEQNNRLLIEQAPIGIVIMQDGVVTNVNPQFLEIFGYNTQDEVHGRPAEDFIAPQDRELFTQRSKDRMLGKPVPLQYDIGGLKKNGYAFDLAMWPKIIDYDGKPAILIFCADTSEAKALKAQLIQAQKMEAIGTLAGGIAHDFNNIIFAITGYTELALDEVPAESHTHKYLERILSAAKRAGDMTGQILAFSRKTEMKRVPTQLTPIVMECLKFLRGSIPSTIEISHRIEPDLSKVLADSTQIHQVMMNLCTNASNAMRDRKGLLRVELSGVEVDRQFASLHPPLVPGKHIKLTISDTGGGIPSDIIDRIFEPYFTTSQVGEGTGLGLSVVHGIVQSHGGTITVQSEIQKGTTFDVYFQVIEGDSETEEEKADKDISRAIGRVLLVDDEELVRDMCSSILAGLGYTVTTCENGVEALELFQPDPGRFDLVITDLTMPKMTGTELAKHIKSSRPELPIILCTGFIEEFDVEKIESLGIRAVMKKPISKKDMGRVIREVLGAGLILGDTSS